MALSPMQEAFVNEYLKCRNATQAAKAAGYSAKTAYSKGHALKHEPEIAKAIQERFDEAAMTAGEVLALLAEQARAAYAEYLTVGADQKPFVDVARMIADGKAHLIKSLKYTRNGINVEFHSAESARELIARVHGLMTDKIEHSGEVLLVNVDK